jgi:hypothetical protein
MCTVVIVFVLLHKYVAEKSSIESSLSLPVIAVVFRDNSMIDHS